MMAFFVTLAAAVFLAPFAVEAPDALNGWAWVIPVVGAAVSAIGGMAGGKAEAEAADAQREASYAQAVQYSRKMRHEIKRAQREERIMRGQATAAIYASGVDMAGSPLKHMGAQHRYMMEDIKELKRARSEGFEAIQKGAQLQHDASAWRQRATQLQGWGGAAVKGAEAFHTWKTG